MDLGVGGRRGVVSGAPTGSTPGEEFQEGGRSAASSVGRHESDSRRGVLLRRVGSGVMSEIICAVTESVGKGGGTEVVGEMGEGTAGDERGEEREREGCGT